ncbi:MAG: rfaQ 5 [Bacteroidetes bacterium]|jgi:ADP-heptose:LPS heptosyltransferase|nr:rfaQ 5 [Bacteroidota bacterium]
MSKKIIIASWGGIGDAMVITPTLRAIKELHPKHKLIVYCNPNHYPVFKNNPHIDSLRVLGLGTLLLRPGAFISWIKYLYPKTFISWLLKPFGQKYILTAFQHIPLTWAYKKSVIEIVPEIFEIELKHKKIEIFLNEQEDRKAREVFAGYKNPILMHIHSRSSSNHHWDMDKWAELVKQLPDYTFIQCGHTDEPYVEGAVDWRGKTELRDAICMLKYATSFVGVDSSFSHATNAFDLPGVVLFGDSTPVIWGHNNNINIYKGIPCSPCYYDLGTRPCLYSNECMKLITVEDVKEAVIKQVNVSNQRKQMSMN